MRVIYFCNLCRPFETSLTLKEWNITLVNSVKYLDVVLEKETKRRWDTGIITAKAFRILIRVYSLFSSESQNTNIKLTFHIALIKSVITYTPSYWEFAADINLLLQRMDKKILIIGNFSRCISTQNIFALKFRTCKLYYKIVHAANRS
jgi:hypothetical protein